MTFSALALYRPSANLRASNMVSSVTLCRHSNAITRKKLRVTAEEADIKYTVAWHLENN